MVKSKSGMGTNDTPCPAINAFPNEVVKEMSLLSLGRYIFSIVSGNRYLPRATKEILIFITITGE